MMWEIKKSGQVYACGNGSHGYNPVTIRDMSVAGYVLYLDGKRQKKPTQK